MIGCVSHVEESLHAQPLQAKALILICLAQTSVLAERLLGGEELHKYIGRQKMGAETYGCTISLGGRGLDKAQTAERACG